MENKLNNIVDPKQKKLYLDLSLIIQSVSCYFNRANCNHNSCSQFINLSDHIRNCNQSDECEIENCNATILLMKHYLNCTQVNCVCFLFGLKSTENNTFGFIKDSLLRNQFLIWRRKVIPHRSDLIDRLSEKLANLTDQSQQQWINQQLTEFDSINFEKSKGISTYLNNFSKNAFEVLVKVRKKSLENQGENSVQSESKFNVYGINDKTIIESIYGFLRKFSTDVLHNRINIEYKSIWTKTDIASLFTPIHKRICQERKGLETRLINNNNNIEDCDNDGSVESVDLLGIYNKLVKERAYSDLWDIVNDYWTLINRWDGVSSYTSSSNSYDGKSVTCRQRLSKRPTSRIARVFGELVDKAMRGEGLCCGRLLEYAPLPLMCVSQGCSQLIGRDESFYRVSETPHIVICSACFNFNPNSSSVIIAVSNDDETDDSQSVLESVVEKRSFEQHVNSEREREEMIECVKCRRRWHRVCAGHLDEIWPSGFYCPRCEPSQPHGNEINKTNPLTSAALPQTPLSRHIESRLDEWRCEQNQTVPPITVRVLSARHKLLNIKPEMRKAFVETGELPDSLPYEQLSVFAFQQVINDEINTHNKSSEICLFGMQCQHFSSDCPQPNRQRVYVAYLDSVQYFRPNCLRTEFYHRLLIAYLEFCSLQGFLYAHIWACPPADGDEYIFFCHPPYQKLPKTKRLQEWYVLMLNKAIKEGIVIDYCDIFTYAYNSSLMSPSELPYFEGDYWPTALEELLQETVEDSPETEIDGISKKRKKLKKIPSKNVSKRRRQTDQNTDTVSESTCNSEDSGLMKRLFDLLDRRKDNFIVVRLSNDKADEMSISSPSSSKTTGESQPDITQMGELMDGRDRFLSLCREKRLEFSTERRARFATLSLCYELHLELNGGVLYSCNRCHRLLINEERYTCLSPDCVEFELCVSCSRVPQSHPHQLTRISPNEPVPILSDQSNNSNIQSNQSIATEGQSSSSNVQSVQSNTPNNPPNHSAQSSIDDKKQRLIAAIKMLQHAFSCQNVKCGVLSCPEWKKHVSHYSQCQSNQNCGVCPRLERLSSLHAKLCRDNSSCAVPLCVRNRQLSMQSRLWHASSERRRIDNENNEIGRRTIPQIQSANQVCIIPSRPNISQGQQIPCAPRNIVQYQQPAPPYRSIRTDSSTVATTSGTPHLYRSSSINTGEVYRNQPNSRIINNHQGNNTYYLYNYSNGCTDINNPINLNNHVYYSASSHPGQSYPANVYSTNTSRPPQGTVVNNYSSPNCSTARYIDSNKTVTLLNPNVSATSVPNRITLNSSNVNPHKFIINGAIVSRLSSDNAPTRIVNCNPNIGYNNNVTINRNIHNAIGNSNNIEIFTTNGNQVYFGNFLGENSTPTHRFMNQ